MLIIKQTEQTTARITLLYPERLIKAPCHEGIWLKVQLEEFFGHFPKTAKSRP